MTACRSGCRQRFLRRGLAPHAGECAHFTGQRVCFRHPPITLALGFMLSVRLAILRFLPLLGADARMVPNDSGLAIEEHCR